MPWQATRSIASDLYVSLNTVKTHAYGIFRKLGVTGRRQAVRPDDIPELPESWQRLLVARVRSTSGSPSSPVRRSNPRPGQSWFRSSTDPSHSERRMTGDTARWDGRLDGPCGSGAP